MTEKYIKEKRKMELIGLEVPVISEDDNLGIEYLADLISSYPLKDGDIVVVAETLISKLEGKVIKKEDVKPTPLAHKLAKKLGKSPEVVQVILDQAKEIVKIGDGFIITETKHGFVCANSGVDESNIKEETKTRLYTLLSDVDLKFNQELQRLKENNHFDLDVHIDVLKQQIKN